MAAAARWQCPSCGAEAVAQDAAFVARARQLHRCPDPTSDPLVLAVKGAYDG